MEGGRSDEGELRSQGLTCFLTTPRSDPSTQTRYFQTHPKHFRVSTRACGSYVCMSTWNRLSVNLVETRVRKVVTVSDSLSMFLLVCVTCWHMWTKRHTDVWNRVYHKKQNEIDFQKNFVGFVTRPVRHQFNESHTLNDIRGMRPSDRVVWNVTWKSVILSPTRCIETHSVFILKR
jgi:hypothetical protein